MKKILVIILTIFTMYICIANRSHLFKISGREIVSAEKMAEITNNENTEPLYGVWDDVNRDYWYQLGMIIGAIAVLLGIVGIFLRNGYYNEVAALFTGGFIAVVCVYVLVNIGIFRKPLQRSIYRTLEVEMDLEKKSLKNRHDAALYFLDAKLSHEKVIELANKADFYHVTKGHFDKYEKINDDIFNKAVRKVYADEQYSKYIDMSNFDVRKDDLRKKHEELNQQQRSAENWHETNFDITAKQIKVEYDALMDHEEKVEKLKQDILEKLLQEEAAENGENEEIDIKKLERKQKIEETKLNALIKLKNGLDKLSEMLEEN